MICVTSTQGVTGTRPDHLSLYVVNPVRLQAHWQVSICVYAHKSRCMTNPTTPTHKHSLIKELENDWYQQPLAIKCSSMNWSQSPRSVTRKRNWMNLKENLDQYDPSLYSHFSFSPLCLKRNVSREFFLPVIFLPRLIT